jgi:hypothetical protein
MLTVVTLTRNERPNLLARCKESVKAAMPAGGKHCVIECLSDFANTRFMASQIDEFVAFVDDDDTIHPDSLKLCLLALKSTGFGLAVTNEIMVNLEGKLIQHLRGEKSYGGISKHPRTIHHLCVFRSNAVDHKALELNTQFGIGIDWFIKASAALKYGAVHVQIDGYSWTQHEHTMTRKDNPIYNDRFIEMGEAIRNTWPRVDTPLEIFALN